jgi:hypothetical protein
MKKIITVLLAFVAIASIATIASAQDVLTYNLHTGMKADGQVVILQNFLLSQGFLSGTNATGNFGPLTAKAVATYQGETGISQTGFVGPLTRAHINSLINGNGGVTFTPGCTSAEGFSAIDGTKCVAIQPSNGIVVAPVSISSITQNSANLSSSYKLPSTATYNTVWFEYSTSQSDFTTGTPSKLGQIVLQGSSGTFTTTLANLNQNATYYARAVVEGQDKSITTSSVVSFTTGTTVGGAGTITGTYQNQSSAMSGQALIGTNAAMSVTDTSAVFSGVFDGRGSDTTVWFQYWAGSSAITNTTQIDLGTSAGSSSFIAVGLNPSTYYSYRMVATNQYGTVYGTTIAFSTTASQSSNNQGYGTTGTQYIYVYNTTGGTTTGGTTPGGTSSGTTSGVATSGQLTSGGISTGTVSGGLTAGTGGTTAGTAGTTTGGTSGTSGGTGLGTTAGGTSLPIYNGGTGIAVNPSHLQMVNAPTVTTNSATNITATTAVLNATIYGFSSGIVYPGFGITLPNGNYIFIGGPSIASTSSATIPLSMTLTGNMGTSMGGTFSLVCGTHYSFKPVVDWAPSGGSSYSEAHGTPVSFTTSSCGINPNAVVNPSLSVH